MSVFWTLFQGAGVDGDDERVAIVYGDGGLVRVEWCVLVASSGACRGIGLPTRFSN